MIWNASSSATYYVAYMSLSPIDENTSLETLVSSPRLGANVLNYTFVGAKYGDHWFIVVSVNATGASNWSNIIEFSNISPTEGMSPQIEVLVIIGSVTVSAVVVILVWYIIRKRNLDPDRLMKKFL